MSTLLRSRGNPRELLEQTARRYGDVVFVRTGGRGFYLVSHPDLVRSVLDEHDDRFHRIDGERRVSRRIVRDALFTSEDELHARQRSLMEPVLYGRTPSTDAETVVAAVERMTRDWETGRTVDVMDWAARMTTGLMVKVLFGLDVWDAEDPRGAQLADAIVRAGEALVRVPLGPTSIPDRLRLPGATRLRRAVAHLDGLIDEVAEQRRSEGLRSPDVLTGLLAATAPNGERMGTAQARDECIALFRGQQLVAAASFSFTWFLLARHPEIEARMHEEIDAALRGDDRRPVAEDLAALPFTLAVFREALRLYPSAWVLARTAVREHTAGDHTIPAGATVLCSPWVVHRDPRFWDDPLRFDPTRFEGFDGERTHPAYFPQGAGPKRCMGMELLPVEAALVLATVGRTWRLRVPPDHVVRVSGGVFLRPKGGLPMVLEPRGGRASHHGPGPG